MHKEGPEGPQHDDDAIGGEKSPADGALEPAQGEAEEPDDGASVAGDTAVDGDAAAEAVDADSTVDAAGSDRDTGETEVRRTSVLDRIPAEGEPVDDRHGSDQPTVVTTGPMPAADAGADVDDNDQDGAVTPKKTPRKKRRLAKVGLWATLILLVLAGAYVGSAYLLADRVPADTTVAGVDVSGLSSEQAEQVLDEELGGLETEPLTLTFEEAGAQIEPASAGLSFDAGATVARFTGFTLDPRILLGHLFGLGDQEPVTHTDTDTLQGALQTIAQDLDVAPVEGSIAIVDAAAQITEPQNGAAVDVPAATDLLAQEWITGERPLALPVEVVEPTIGPEQIDTAMTEVVEPFLSGPVIVAVSDSDTEVELTTAELAAAATLEVDGARILLVLDGAELAEVVTAKEDSIGETPSDARIELQDGAPVVVPAVTGTGLDPTELGESVHEASLRSEDRVAPVELSQTEAEFTTADAEALGVVEVIGRYSTPMPYDPPRTENLQIGTSRINNTLILPGERFSLLDALSPISVAGGYNSSGVVVDGFATEAAGGGLSQLSTTAFNAAFEAGMEDVTHQPHSRWFSRYPEGREATLFSPDLDMIFANNTDYGVLIQSWVGDGQTHVVLWGTDVWDVNITTGGRYNITSPQTVYNQSPRCTPESGGQSGFSVQYTRTVSAGGEVHEQRTYTHTYRPWNRVVCGSPPSASDSDDDNGDDDD